MVSAAIRASHTTGLDPQFRGSWFENFCRFSLKKLEFYSTKLYFSVADGSFMDWPTGKIKGNQQ